MEKKGTIISLILVTIIVGASISTIIISGITASKYNYVQIEVNPRAEFICDNKFDVVSVAPLNADAEIVLSDMNLVGDNIDKAVVKFIDECARCGYIDINGVNNSTNITIIDGLTQALDVHITQMIYNYFRKSEILSSVTETYEVREIANKKKEAKVACSNKYKLITTINEQQPEHKIEYLRKLSEVELVDMVRTKHKENPYSPTQENIDTKAKLLANNESAYRKHMQAINNNSQQEFSEMFNKFQKLSSKQYFQDFEKEYTIWQKRHS